MACGLRVLLKTRCCCFKNKQKKKTTENASLYTPCAKLDLRNWRRFKGVRPKVPEKTFPKNKAIQRTAIRISKPFFLQGSVKISTVFLSGWTLVATLVVARVGASLSLTAFATALREHLQSGWPIRNRPFVRCWPHGT